MATDTSIPMNQSVNTRIPSNQSVGPTDNAPVAAPVASVVSAAPVTNPAPTLPSTPPAATTSKSATTDFNGLANQLQGIFAQKQDIGQPDKNDANDPYIQMLNSVSQQHGASTKSLINTIIAQRSNQGNRIDAQYQNYKAALQSLGIQHNEAQFTPDLLQGHIKAAENEHQAKLQDLNVQMDKALMDAETAQSNNDLSTMKESLARHQQLKQEQQDYLKNIADNIGYEAKINDSVVGAVWDQIKDLSPEDQNKQLQNIAATYADKGVSLAALTIAIANKAAEEKKTSLATQQAEATLAHTKAETANIGAGGNSKFNTSNEIKGLTPVIEQLKGEDNFIDPYKWVAMRARWQSLGGTEASFKSNFIKYLNPGSYKLAGYKAPTGTPTIPTH